MTQINEHPILFSTSMVQAILEGRKTITRRILKVKGCVPFIPDPGFTLEDILRWNRKYHPYGQPGDLLWVREKFSFLEGKFEPEDTYSFFADNFHWSFAQGDSPNGITKIQWHDLDLSKELKWKPSIHMPKLAARIWLKITSIKVEKLQDISEEDAIREGILPILMSRAKLKERGQWYFDYTKPKQLFNEGLPPFWSFNSLWCSINDSDSWESNPWVWVIEFKILSTTGKPAEL